MYSNVAPPFATATPDYIVASAGRQQPKQRQTTAVVEKFREDHALLCLVLQALEKLFISQLEANLRASKKGMGRLIGRICTCHAFRQLPSNALTWYLSKRRRQMPRPDYICRGQRETKHSKTQSGCASLLLCKDRRLGCALPLQRRVRQHHGRTCHVFFDG